MAYFNHAFFKRFLGTGSTLASPFVTADGFITDSGVSTEVLSQQSPGYFGFFDPNTWLSVNETDLAAATDCCPLLLASSSLLSDDKVGPFHGGYKETNKSKMINPRYVRRIYRADQCTPQQAVVHIGNTHYTGTAAGAVETITNLSSSPGAYTEDTYIGVPVTGGGGTGLTVDIVVDANGDVVSVTVNQGGTGYADGDINLTVDGSLLGGTTPGDDVTFDVLDASDVGQADCNKVFYCDETYYLRLDLKGSPLLRYANHNVYQNFQADGGCCDGPEPEAIDSTLIFIQWAQQIIESDYMKDFVRPVVFDQNGNPWFATEAEAVAAGWPTTQTWDQYTSPGYINNTTGGMRLIGAFVETQFGDCSFESTDFFEKEPIRIYASLVDYTGDPCVFEGLCVITECLGIQGNGFGEQVLRDFILSEKYLTNTFANDKRIREITQGDDILAAINRNALYTRYYIQHVVPRFNNPSGVFDNDQYMLEVVTEGPNAALESFLVEWLDEGCSDCTLPIEVESCATCTISALPTP